MNKQFVRALCASTAFIAATTVWADTSFAAAAAVPTAADAIGGVVTSAKGPEAGVWVIAETNDLPTRLIKIVVTDDQGRYMLPELPTAKYQVWVRGYGLVDSKKVEGAPGKNINLTAVVAPDAKAAAEIYPANYWYALIEPPKDADFPGTGPKGNGISPAMQTQQMWISHMKDGCIQCHQFGDRTTRNLMDNTPEGWAERISKARPDDDHVLGDHGKDFANDMSNRMTRFGRARGLKMFTDWTQAIAKGALPKETPPRPSGVERNLVLTSWDWANGRYVHDSISADRHNPGSNPNGPVFGVIGMGGYIEVLYPTTGKQEEFGYEVTPNVGAKILPSEQSPDAFPHNPMLDKKNRLWITDLGRYGAPLPNQKPFPDNLPFCTSGKYGSYYPLPGKARTMSLIFDNKTKSLEGIPMCAGTHHLMPSADSKWMVFSGGSNKVVSWVDIDTWDATHDPAKSVGWCPMVLDTNATTTTGRPAATEVSITPDHKQWNEPAPQRQGGAGEEGGGDAAVKAVFDPKKDTRIEGFLYGTDAEPKTGAMWFAQTNPFPTGVVYQHPGANPPETCHTEYYQPPKLPNGKYAAFNGRGISGDGNGVAWVAYGSGQFGKFDRSQCKVTRGATIVEGQHCPEGWYFYDSPGPKLTGVSTGSADHHYLNWVDLHDTLGLGKDTPMYAGSNSDSLIAVDDKNKKLIVLRVPYPLGFHTRGMDGRFDGDPKNWKGKGVFATYASQPVWHQEGGEDASGPQLVKFQIRPDPLAH